MLFYSLLSFLLTFQSITTELERRHGGMRHVHEAAHHARRSEPPLVTEIATEEVIVYQNAQGQALATSTSTFPAQLVINPIGAPATPSPSSLPPKPSTNGDQKPKTPAPEAHGAASGDASGKSTDNTGSSTHVGPGFKLGAVYNAVLANGQCRSAAQVKQDIDVILQKGHDLIRMYDTGCQGVARVSAAIKGKSVSMFLGLPSPDTLGQDIPDLVKQLNHGFSQVNSIAVGNELVDSNTKTPAQVVAGINVAKRQLRAAGYNGPVVTVDTMIAVKQHPELCTDYCAINCHAFYDGGVQASGAGDFVKWFAGNVSIAAGGKQVVVTETGWPCCGSNKQQAVPGPSEQSAAIQSLKLALPNNVIILSPFNEYWKTENQYNVERCWGIYGDSPSAQ